MYTSCAPRAQGNTKLRIQCLLVSLSNGYLKKTPLRSHSPLLSALATSPRIAPWQNCASRIGPTRAEKPSAVDTPRHFQEPREEKSRESSVISFTVGTVPVRHPTKILLRPTTLGRFGFFFFVAFVILCLRTKTKMSARCFLYRWTWEDFFSHKYSFFLPFFFLEMRLFKGNWKGKIK